MPYPNFHACRLEDPGKFSRLRQIVQGGVHVIVGRLKGEQKMVTQAIRYPKDSWTVAKARASCDEKGGSFEPAAPSAEQALERVPMLAVQLQEGEMERLLAGKALEWTEDRLQQAGLAEDEDGSVAFAEGDGALPTVDMKNVEIGAAGTFISSQGNRVTFTTEVLDKIVENFQKYKDLLKPYFKLMHLDERTHRQVAAAPAIGWIDSVRRVGTKLVADLSKVPRLVAQLIEARAYRRISPEVYLDWYEPNSGVRDKFVLKAAGLLGAETPAIKTLQDVPKLYAERYGVPALEEAVAVAFASGQPWPETVVAEAGTLVTFYDCEWPQEPAEGGDIAMTPEELQKAMAGALTEAMKPVNQRLDALEAKGKGQEFAEGEKDKVLKALGAQEGETAEQAAARLRKDSEDSTSALQKFSDTQQDEAVDKLIAGAVKAGRLLPAHKEMVKDRFRMWCGQAKDSQDMLVAFTEPGEGKQEQRVTPMKALELYLATLPQVLSFSEQGSRGSAVQKKGGVLPADAAAYAEEHEYAVDEGSLEVDGKIRAKMRESAQAGQPMTYSDAMDAVLGTSPVPEPGKEQDAMAGILPA